MSELSKTIELYRRIVNHTIRLFALYPEPCVVRAKAWTLTVGSDLVLIECKNKGTDYCQHKDSVRLFANEVVALVRAQQAFFDTGEGERMEMRLELAKSSRRNFNGVSVEDNGKELRFSHA